MSNQIEPADELLAMAKQAPDEREPDSYYAGALIVHPDASLGSLLAADDVLMRRILKRVQYGALKTLLNVLDGWISGAHENADAGSGSHADAEQFHAEDIRRMINDAARELGVREPYREGKTDA